MPWGGDGFNVWNAVTNLWPSRLQLGPDSPSMRSMLADRLENGQLSILRPDSGEGVETLSQLLTLLYIGLEEHWEKDLKPWKNPFPAGDPYATKYDNFVDKLRKKFKLGADANPFRRCKGQQLRVLQGDGVALDSLGDMLAGMVTNRSHDLKIEIACRQP